MQWRSHGACGWALRFLGGFERADAHYQRCVEIGELLDDPDARFRGLKGIAMTARTKGNLPRAEADTVRLLEWAVQLGRLDFESEARHHLGVILGLQGRHHESICELERALAATGGEHHDRLMMDLAFSRAQTGQLERARLAFMTVVENSSDQQTVLLARVNLIQIYSAYGDRVSIDAQRRILDAVSLPAVLATDFHLTLGLAYVALGEHELALQRFERAREIAEETKIGRTVIEADEHIAHLRRRHNSVTDSSGPSAHEWSDPVSGLSPHLVFARRPVS
jgi:tetratricopeptide (TPR) repeat protein